MWSSSSSYSRISSSSSSSSSMSLSPLSSLATRPSLSSFDRLRSECLRSSLAAMMPVVDVINIVDSYTRPLICVTGGNYSCVRLWDLDSGDLVQEMKCKSKNVTAVAVSRDRQIIVSGCDTFLNIWELHTGLLLKEVQQKSTVLCITLTKNNRFVLNGGMDGTVSAWEWEYEKTDFRHDSQQQSHYHHHHHHHHHHQAHRSDTDTTLIRFFKLNEFKAHDAVNDIIVDNENKYIISAGRDHTVKIWNFDTGRLIETLTAHTQPVLALALNPNNMCFVSASQDNSLCVWSMEGQQCFRLTAKPVKVHSVCVSRDGNFIVSGLIDGSLEVWDVWKGQLVHSITTESPVRAVAVDQKTGLVVSGHATGVYLWDLVDGRLIEVKFNDVHMRTLFSFALALG